MVGRLSSTPVPQVPLVSVIAKGWEKLTVSVVEMKIASQLPAELQVRLDGETDWKEVEPLVGRLSSTPVPQVPLVSVIAKGSVGLLVALV